MALGVFASTAFDFLTKGHTHEDIDANFGWLAAKLAAERWGDEEQCLQLLRKHLTDMQTDFSLKGALQAYQLDNSANWSSWSEDIWGIQTQMPHWAKGAAPLSALPSL